VRRVQALFYWRGLFVGASAEEGDEMRIRLPLPREERFFRLLRSGAEVVLESAEAFMGLLEHYDERDSRVAALKEIEERGDQIIHDIMYNLHRTFVTPIDREDIALLAEHLDDVVDAIEEAARMLVEYRVEAPTEQMKELGRIALDSARELMQAIDKLRFRGARLKEILPHCVEVNSLENEADQACSKAIGDLFRGAESPINVIKLRDIYAMLEHTADLCEDAANVLEGVVLKNA
jgi:predicted phosphate transport protein (TIGR00153 family)